MKIVVLDRDTLPKQAFAFDFAHQLVEYGRTAPDQTAERIQDADIIITNKVVITGEMIQNNKQLKLIALSATGYNNVDIDTAKQSGVAVCNIRDYSSDSVAEHAFMLMLALMRNLPAYMRDVSAGMWQNSPYFCHFGAPIRDLNDKTLSIFGKGNIGKQLAHYAQAFGMKVIFGEHKHTSSIREGYVAFDEAIKQADVVSLHCPLNENTRHMIGEAELKMMKPQAILINVGRGGLVDETALIGALKYGQLGGAGFDVLSVEPPHEGNPLLSQLPNLIVTPHVAWTSEEALDRLFKQLHDNINGFIRGNPQNLL